MFDKTQRPKDSISWMELIKFYIINSSFRYQNTRIINRIVNILLSDQLLPRLINHLYDLLFTTYEHGYKLLKLLKTKKLIHLHQTTTSMSTLAIMLGLFVISNHTMLLISKTIPS